LTANCETRYNGGNAEEEFSYGDREEYLDHNRQTAYDRGPVAKKAGLSYEAVQRLHNGTSKRVALVTIDKLCQVLECDADDLFEYVPETSAISPARTHERWNA
jgi:DNA-binding Xre family transcriptional regulator